jgi:adenine-specific DNA-methyltransferase
MKIRDDNPVYSVDLGFKAYKTTRSNHKKWGKYIINTPKEADNLFKEHEHSLVDGWEYDSVLTEVILTEGFPLTSIIQSVSDVTSNSIAKISSPDKEYALYVCLDDTIKSDTIKAAEMNDNDVFVCLGSAIDDQNLSALHDKGRIRIL